MREMIEKNITGLFSDEVTYTYHFIASNGMKFHTEGKTEDACRQQMHRWMKGFSVAFSGHRRIRITEDELRKRIAASVQQCYGRGIRFFYTGGAMGFDTLAAEEILKFKKANPDLVLILVVPFRQQSDLYPTQDRSRYMKTLQHADEVRILSENYFPQCYFKRNDYMVSRSSELIVYWDNISRGGTFYTVRKALGAKIKLHNLY